MEILNVTTTTEHLIEEAGLQYVRYSTVVNGETRVRWKRNFDWQVARANESLILSDVQLEILFAYRFVERFKLEEENQSEVIVTPAPQVPRQLPKETKE